MSWGAKSAVVRVEGGRRTDDPGYGGKRIVDMLLAGQGAEVLDELRAGRLDVLELLEQGELQFYGW